MALAALVLLGVERRLHAAAAEDARRDVAERLVGYERALSNAVIRRAGILYGARTWLQLGGAGWESTFDEFAAGITAGVDGVRAVQVVQGGIIRHTWPLQGNESAVGLDLREHPLPRIVEDLWRAHDTGDLVVSDPVELVQGGEGIVLRLSAGPPGDRDAPSAAAVLDLQPVLREAGLTSTAPLGMTVFLQDAGGRIFHGDSATAAADPVRMPVRLPDRGWVVGAVPGEGWDGLVAGRHRFVVGAGAVVVVLMGVLTYAFVGRQVYLEGAVERRTVELAEAMSILQEQEAFLSGALQAGRVFAWAWEPGTDRVQRSAGLAAYLGLAPEGTLSDVSSRVHPDDRDALAEAQGRAVESGALSVEYRLTRPDGTVVWVRDEGRLVDDGVRPPRLVGAMADVTRVKELEHRLLHARRMEEVGRLAAVVAHDFNNLLTVMQVNLELAREGGAGAADDLAQVAQAIDHAHFLTRKLLTFSRRDVVSPESLEVDAVLREVVDLVRPLLGSAATLALTPGAPGAWVRMDRGQLTQIVFNLAVNARDAMPEGGRVELRTEVRRSSDGSDEPSGDFVALVVEDAGTGIPPQTLPTIFDAFVTTKGHERGTGLGLSTVRTIVEGAGGRVWAENRREGGARFVVLLPLRGGDASD